MTDEYPIRGAGDGVRLIGTTGDGRMRFADHMDDITEAVRQYCDLRTTPDETDVGTLSLTEDTPPDQFEIVLDVGDETVVETHH